MSDNKENKPLSLGGPAAASTTSASKDSKAAKSTTNKEIQDSLVHDANDGLDDVVYGGCSTCGSAQHDTVKCDRKDVPAEYMMSGALQTDMNPSACATGTAAPAVKGYEAESVMTSGEDAGAGRRHSV